MMVVWGDVLALAMSDRILRSTQVTALNVVMLFLISSYDQRNFKGNKGKIQFSLFAMRNECVFCMYKYNINFILHAGNVIIK